MGLVFVASNGKEYVLILDPHGVHFEERTGETITNIFNSSPISVWTYSGDFPYNWISATYGTVVGFGLFNNDKYFLGFGSNSNLYIGKALNNATSITWTQVK